MKKTIPKNTIGIGIFSQQEEDAIRNDIIIRIKSKTAIYLSAIASKYVNSHEEAIAVVNDFIADNLCEKDIIELLQIDAFGYAYIGTMIRNYIISQKRIETRIRNQKERISETIRKDDLVIEAPGIDETERQIQIIRASIIEKFNEKYALIFELKARGIENIDIAEKTGDTTNYIRVAISRIRKYLKDAV